MVLTAVCMPQGSVNLTVPDLPLFKPIELAHNVQRVALGELLRPGIASIKSFRISNLHSFRELVSWVQFPVCLRA
jgi:hypothetical protein